MKTVKRSFFLLFIGLLFLFGTASAKNVTEKTDQAYIITLDADFWSRSESVKDVPKIVINAQEIQPGNVLCYYHGIGSEYTYKFEEFKDNKVLILRKHKGIDKNLKSTLPVDSNSEVIIVKPENKYQKVFHLFIKDVEIKIKPVKKTGAIKAKPVDIIPEYGFKLKLF